MQVIPLFYTLVSSWGGNLFTFILIYRKKLTAALKEARQAILLDVNREAVFIVEVKNEVDTLCSVTELQPKVSFRMSIPYRFYCAYAFAKGNCVSCSWRRRVVPRINDTFHNLNNIFMFGITRRWHLSYDRWPLSSLIVTCRASRCVIGKLFVTGGYLNNTLTNQADVIDLVSQSGTVTSLPPMQEARSNHALAAAGSLVFVFGGRIKRGEGEEWTSSCEFFDSRTNRWV